MKTVFTLLLFTAGTFFSNDISAQTVTGLLNEILLSTDRICDAIDEADDATNDFTAQVAMGTATSADATNFRNRITAAMIIVEEQQDEIASFIFQAAAIDPSIDPSVIAGLASQVEAQEDFIQNFADEAVAAFNAGDINLTLNRLKKVRNALHKQKSRTQHIVNRTNHLLNQQ